jgi:hypothetical protein
MENPVVGRGKAQADGQPTKKPYKKPSFRCERVFETQALSCGKISVTQKHCRFNRKGS